MFRTLIAALFLFASSAAMALTELEWSVNVNDDTGVPVLVERFEISIVEADGSLTSIGSVPILNVNNFGPFNFTYNAPVGVLMTYHIVGIARDTGTPSEPLLITHTQASGVPVLESGSAKDI